MPSESINLCGEDGLIFGRIFSSVPSEFLHLDNTDRSGDAPKEPIPSITNSPYISTGYTISGDRAASRGRRLNYDTANCCLVPSQSYIMNLET